MSFSSNLDDRPASDPDIAVVPRRYATFNRRFRAVLTDSVLVVLGVMLVLIAADATGRVSGSGIVAWLVMFSIFFLYEPLFVWRRGATIGHSMNHLTVVADGTGRPPGFARAFVRYFIKLVMGLPSFVTMMLSPRHQAVHDLLTRTTVQLAADTDPDLVDFHVEREDEPATLLPSRTRRTIVALAYLVLLFIIYAMVLVVIDPGSCARQGTCSHSMQVIFDLLAPVWLVASLASIVAVWKGRMVGARRRRDSHVDMPVV